jgi:hypothetical protein
MFARHVSIHLKSNMLSDYTRTIENDTLPLLRQQKGFKDEITLSNPGSPDVIAISLWESKANAETYNTNTYPQVLRTFALCRPRHPDPSGYGRSTLRRGQKPILR